MKNFITFQLFYISLFYVGYSYFLINIIYFCDYISFFNGILQQLHPHPQSSILFVNIFITLHMPRYCLLVFCVEYRTNVDRGMTGGRVGGVPAWREVKGGQTWRGRRKGIWRVCSSTGGTPTPHDTPFSWVNCYLLLTVINLCSSSLRFQSWLK